MESELTPSRPNISYLAFNAAGIFPAAFLLMPRLDTHLHQHHPIEVPMFVPSAQPTDFPFPESRAQLHRVPQTKKLSSP